MKKTNMRAGFTMIELIFVIVIIGILAAIAMNKLSATRDDAKITKSISNLKTCIGDMAARYTAQGDLNNTDLNTSVACKETNSENCFAVSIDNNGTQISVTNGTLNNTWCSAARTDATAKSLDGNHTIGGTSINRN